MENKIYGTIGSLECGLRLLITTSLIVAVLLLALPSWVALVSIYLFTTALIARDPVYLIVQYIQSMFSRNKVILERLEEV